MTAQQLKNSILQMAVQGKLVPQDSNDEHASLLLERIKAEKQELIKAGKIKKDKKTSEIFRGASRNLPYAFCEQVGKEIRDISEEVPFEIPDSWEWCRLGTVFQHNTGKALNSSNQQGTKMQYITTSNLYWDRFELDKLKEMLFTESEIEKCTVTKGDLLVCEGGDIGRAAIWNYDYPMRIQNHIHRLRPYATVDMYFFYFIFNLYKHSGLIGGKGIGIQGLSSNAIDKLLIPLPPLSEQHRIVTKIEELLPYIEKYGKSEENLTTLNTSFPEALKKSILQEAVQGRLVPQDPNDEPASVLLERIRAEKQALVKAGKIKKDKHESVIVTRDKIPYEIIDGKERCIADEVPFEIPEGWCWCRLKDMSIIITKGSSPKWQGVSYVENDGIPFITSENVGEEKMLLDKIKYVEGKFNDMHPVSILQQGDLLTNIVGASIGRTTIFNIPILNANINQAVCIIRLVDSELGAYLVKFLNSPIALKMMTSNSVESARANLSLTSVGDFFIPLPPLAEQKRIVKKIEELMQYCNKL